MYAVTRRNKWLAGVFSALIAMQLCFGVYFTVRIGLAPPRPFLEIDLDVFKICFIKRWRRGELVFANLAIAFDILAFITIFVTARRPGVNRYPGIPSILDTILRDATVYFILMFFSQFLYQVLYFVAPEVVQPLPGIANTILVPVMASRIMLSLKKAAVEPRGTWSLTTMGDSGRGMPPEDETLHFASRVPGRSGQVLETPTLPNEVYIELESAPRRPQNRGSR
ncbi:hypothetical protein BDM02DRAFT_3109597, partial [Thelephora ganbajun]